MYYKYLKYLLKHKWYVFIECSKNGLTWRGIKHDMSKFLPSEFFPYAYHFNGNHPPTRDMITKNYIKPAITGDDAFDEAWRLHIKRNKHHWQWWAIPELGGGVNAAEMDDDSRMEMLCDWIGAGKVQKTNGIKEWWEKNQTKVQLHEKTREKVNEFIFGRI